MFHIKTYLHIFAVITLFSYAQSLLAMKEIKNHGLKIKKNPKVQNAPEILVPSSIKVFYCSFLPSESKSKSILILDGFRIAFPTNNGIEVWNLCKYGKCQNIFECSNKYDCGIYPGTQNTLAIATNNNNNGSITFWNFYDNTQKKSFLFQDTLIGPHLDLTETQYIFMELPINLDDPKMIIFNLKKPHDSKEIALKEILGQDLTILKDVKNSSLGLKRLSNTKIIFKFAYENSSSYNIYICKFKEKFVVFDTETMMHTTMTDFTTENQNKIKEIKSIDFVGITQKSYACAYQDTISIFDINSGKMIKSLKIENQTHLLNLPIYNALISAGVENNIMNVFNIEEFQDKIQSLKIPIGEYGNIVSVSYVKDTNTVMIITDRRYIVTCQANLKSTKNIPVFFNNMKNSIKQKKFKDLDFKFKYNNDDDDDDSIDDLCEKFKDI